MSKPNDTMSKKKFNEVVKPRLLEYMDRPASEIPTSTEFLLSISVAGLFYDPKKYTVGDAVALVLVHHALRGREWAMRELLQRVDGKVKDEALLELSERQPVRISFDRENDDGFETSGGAGSADSD